MENEDTRQNRSYSPYAGPYGIGCTYRQALRGFGQQSHTHNCKHQETGYPAPPGKAVSAFCPSEAVSKADLAETGNN